MQDVSIVAEGVPIQTRCGWCKQVMCEGVLCDGKESTGICTACRALYFPRGGRTAELGR